MAGGTRRAIEKIHTALVCGDGRVLPIVESVGRRVLREIDSESAEGRALLSSGKVALWYDDGRRFMRAPLKSVLKEIQDASPAGGASRHRGAGKPAATTRLPARRRAGLSH